MERLEAISVVPGSAALPPWSVEGLLLTEETGDFGEGAGPVEDAGCGSPGESVSGVAWPGGWPCGGGG